MLLPVFPFTRCGRKLSGRHQRPGDRRGTGLRVRACDRLEKKPSYAARVPSDTSATVTVPGAGGAGYASCAAA